MLSMALLPGAYRVFGDQEVIVETPDLVYHLLRSTVAMDRLSVQR